MDQVYLNFRQKLIQAESLSDSYKPFNNIRRSAIKKSQPLATHLTITSIRIISTALEYTNLHNRTPRVTLLPTAIEPQPFPWHLHTQISIRPIISYDVPKVSIKKSMAARIHGNLHTCIRTKSEVIVPFISTKLKIIANLVS